MKRTIKLFGIIAIVAVIGFSMFLMSACGGGDDDSDGSGSGGTFTVTGIPLEYNGNYANFVGGQGQVQVFGCERVNNVSTRVQISNGSVRLPMWTTVSGQIVRYSGNHTVNGGIFIANTTDHNAGGASIVANRGWQSITFSNGSATKTWSSGFQGQQ